MMNRFGNLGPACRSLMHAPDTFRRARLPRTRREPTQESPAEERHGSATRLHNRPIPGT